jgi:trans-aconitate methyltransferase
MDRLVKIWWRLPQPLRRPFAWLMQKNRWLYRRLLFQYIDAKDRANVKSELLPPAELRYRVSGAPDAESFVKIGAACAADIQVSLAKVGHQLNSFKRILDFGCGCGRTLRHLVNHLPAAEISGTDIDREAIAWCNEYLDFASFKVASGDPPTDYAPGSFDLIYAISVFTHLDEDYQFRWLAELRRIAQPGAVVLLTVDSGRVGEKGFVFEKSYEKGLFPSWYQNAYHSKDYVLDNFSSYFDVLGYFPKSMNNHQDVVVLRNKNENH